MFKYALILLTRHKLRTFLSSLGISIAIILMSFIIFGMSGLKNSINQLFTSQYPTTSITITPVEMSILDQLNAGKNISLDDTQAIKPITPAIIKEINNLEGVIAINKIIILKDVDLKIPSLPGIFRNAYVIGADSLDITSKSKDKIIPPNNKLYVNQYIKKTYLSACTPNCKPITQQTIILTQSRDSILKNKQKFHYDKPIELKIGGVRNLEKFPYASAIINSKDLASIAAKLGGFSSEDEYLTTIGYDKVIVLTDKQHFTEINDFITNKLKLYTTTPQEVLSLFNVIINSIEVILLLLAIISALIASIGIINTMVMSIYEQTKEIGILKALGASRKQILIIYLYQSLIIGFIGSFLGLIVSYLAMKSLDPFIIEKLNFSIKLDKFFAINLKMSLIIVGFSCIIALGAGLLPAVKASKLDPVKALRYE